MANPVRQTVSVVQSTPRSSMQSSQSAQSPSSAQSGSNLNKSPDYVYFERSSAGFSDEAVPRAKTAQVKLEHYYKVSVDAAIERNTR